MSNFGISIDAFEKDEEMEGTVFELYEKLPNREFKSHIQFIRADSLRDAEDKTAEVNPDYWRTQSIRSVGVTYVWDTFTQLYYSYHMAKSALGLDKLTDE
tara:strand:+ start:4626 stop:4925 length:300 start_codon:yes stop_codon:yes gene_type:complete